MLCRIVLPVTLLALSALFTLISAVALRNHQSLSDSVGATGLNMTGNGRSNRKSALERLTNPFTMTVLVFSAGLAISAVTIPGCVVRNRAFAETDWRCAVLNSLRSTRSSRYYNRWPCSTSPILLR